MTCSLCGKKFSADPCGVGHAANASWIRAGALAERRRIRRTIAGHLGNLRFVNDLHGIVYVKEAADAIDRATKATKRKATKGGS